MCGRNVVAARHDVEHASRKLGGVGASVKCAMVGHHIHAKASDFSVGSGCQFAVHVIVTGKGSGRDIFDAVFNPLDGATQHDGRNDGANIARVDANLVAKSTANVGANDAHFGFGNAGEHGHHGAHHMRCL